MFTPIWYPVPSPALQLAQFYSEKCHLGITLQKCKKKQTFNCLVSNSVRDLQNLSSSSTVLLQLMSPEFPLQKTDEFSWVFVTRIPCRLMQRLHNCLQLGNPYTYLPKKLCVSQNSAILILNKFQLCRSSSNHKTLSTGIFILSPHPLQNYISYLAYYIIFILSLHHPIL